MAASSLLLSSPRAPAPPISRIDALVRQHVILIEEVERAIRRCFSDPSCVPQADEAIGVVRRYLEQSADTSRRALERVRNQVSARRAE